MLATSGTQVVWSWAGAAITSRYVADVGALILATVLLAAALPKLRNLDGTAQAMVSFRVVRRVRRGAAAAVLATETGIAAALVACVALGRADLLVPVLASTVLFATFAVALFRAMRRDDDFPCACFGVGETVGSRPLRRAVVLALIAAGVAAVHLAAELERPTGETLLFESAIAIGLTAIAALCYFALSPFGWIPRFKRIGPAEDPYMFTLPTEG